MKIRRLKEYPGYGVSPDGRVWSKKLRGGRHVGREFLEATHWVEKAQRVDRKTGYYTVWVAQVGGPVCVHVLVALAFLGEIPKGYHVNHIDGVKAHNTLGNLEIVTRLRNLQHAWETGLITVAKPKLTAEQVRVIRQRCASGETQSSVATDFGIDPSGVSDIVKRITWKHVE